MVEENKKQKQEKDAEKAETPVKKRGLGSFKAALLVFKITFWITSVLVIIGIVAYLTLANLAFFGFLPKKMAEKMPIVNKIVQDINQKERKIAWAKQRIEELNSVKKVGELKIELTEDEGLDGSDAVPFLHRIRVVKNKVGDNEFAELWVDRIKVLTFYIGIGQNSPYLRAKYVAKKITAVLNNGEDFETLRPVIEGEVQKALLGENELFRVRKEDSIFNNTSEIELLYEWVNNLRVGMGASLSQVPKFEVTQKELLEEKKEGTSSPDKKLGKEVVGKEPTIAPKGIEAKVTPPTLTEIEKTRIKQLKGVVAVYEKMPDAKVAEILHRMRQKDVAEILEYLSVKKVAKIFPLFQPYKDVGCYRVMTNSADKYRNAKMFKKYSEVWEKMSDDNMIVILNRMKLGEKMAIFRKMSVKKKAKVFEKIPVAEARRYLQLLEKVPK